MKSGLYFPGPESYRDVNVSLVLPLLIVIGFLV